MKKNYLFVFFIFILSSCSTDDNNKEPNPPVSAENCRISSINYSDEIFSYQYADNRITSLTSSEREVLVEYDNKNRIVGYEINDIENDQIQFKKEFLYNNSGLLVEEKNYDLYMGNLTPTSRFEFEYEDSRVIRVNDYDIGSGELEGKTEYSWESGNIISSSFYDENNELECTTEFTFDNSVKNQFKNDFNDFYYLELYDSDYDEVVFFSENLIKSATNTCSENTTNWNFTFNDDGLIQKATLNNSIYWQLTYDCN